jgi:hypothetical protein
MRRVTPIYVVVITCLVSFLVHITLQIAKGIYYVKVSRF